MSNNQLPLEKDEDASNSQNQLIGEDKEGRKCKIFTRKGATTNIILGSRVWVEDPSVAWIDGEVLQVNGEETEIQTTDGKKVVADLSKLYSKDVEAPAGGVDDMTKLSYLHESGVLQNLATRYQLNEIYTYTGNILIAVNPFKRLPHLYDDKMMQRYKGAAFGDLDPHVFAIADAAFSYEAWEQVEERKVVMQTAEVQHLLPEESRGKLVALLKQQGVGSKGWLKALL